MGPRELRTLGVFAVVFANAGVAVAQWEPRPPSRPMTRAQAEAYVFNVAASGARTRELWISYLRMTDAELAKVAASDPQHIIKEAYARARPTVLPVYVNALATADYDAMRAAMIGIGALQDVYPKSNAKATLLGLLNHPRHAVRAFAADQLCQRGIKSALIIPAFQTYLRTGMEPRIHDFAGRRLLKLHGPRDLPLLRQALARIVNQKAKDRKAQIDCLTAPRLLEVLLAEYGDPAALAAVRLSALGRSDRHDRLVALEALCRSRGVREIRTIEACLSGRPDVRTVAMHWLFHFGERSSVAKLRASARDPKQNLSGSGAFRDIPATMLDIAKRIERGEKGPRPPDRYYQRGSLAAWGPNGRRRASRVIPVDEGGAPPGVMQRRRGGSG